MFFNSNKAAFLLMFLSLFLTFKSFEQKAVDEYFEQNMQENGVEKKWKNLLSLLKDDNKNNNNNDDDDRNKLQMDSDANDYGGDDDYEIEKRARHLFLGKRFEKLVAKRGRNLFLG
jgi:hypothetical protein